MTFDDSLRKIAGLCDYFRTNRNAFCVPDVNEARIRQDLVDPLFEALGWDVRNAARVAPQYGEVIPEESLDVEGRRKAPDYTFRVGTLHKFYVEAKKCTANISDDPAPAYQLRRYGWSAKLPLSVLTNFAELAVYDCTMRPAQSDSASRARILHFHFEEYADPDKWRTLWGIFSREAVWSGAFDQFAASKRSRRGTSEVDAEFLKEIEHWRDELARTIALRNPGISQDDLNRAVQVTIDRVVFLRMAEDRGLEPYGQLLKLCDREDAYPNFMRELCRKADDKYNSGLFHFRDEPDIVDEPDRLTPHLVIDDNVFRPIVQSLYFAHGSPYEFSVLPVQILGTVYERFLGKVIRLTAGHRAKVEEKPEVRKAGGVFYTPDWIVDYIVRQTAGTLIDARSPADLAGKGKARAFRVLDMACGSGSFLLGAYGCLLEHCLQWYIQNEPENHGRAVRQDRAGEWQLTVAEKKRILTTHVFGVDIDAQAVEVSKLSLLLKVLEGESDETVGQTMQLFHERALPNLSDNIKCGNSLIGPEYFMGHLIPDQEVMRRVNPFDWSREFPAAMNAGGFDCIIGNPPYIRIQVMKEWAPLEVGICKELFQSARQGNYDIYVVFVEAGLRRLNQAGRLGFILPHKFFNAKYGHALRSMIASGRHLSHAVHFGDQQVFDGPTTYTCLLFLDKAGADRCRYVKVKDLAAWRNGENGVAEGMIDAKRVTAEEWNFTVGNGASLFKKLSGMPVKLGDLAGRMAQGIRTSANEVYVLDMVQESARTITARSERLGKDVKLERAAVSRFLQGREIKRYRILPSRKVVVTPYSTEERCATLISENELKRRFPLAYRYLCDNKDLLRRREDGRFRGREWYQYGREQNIDLMLSPKILVPDIACAASFALDENGEYSFTSGYGIILRPDVRESCKYVLGLLNSRLLDFFLKKVSTTMRGGYFRYFTQFIEKLPIRSIDFANPREKAAHERMVKLVDAMLLLHKQLLETDSAGRRVFQRQIDATDAEIDRLVYALYGLTDEEVAIVESESH